jgi:nucleoside diphosphate kinase
MSELQQTLVVLKPDTIGRSIVGEIISRFEKV